MTQQDKRPFEETQAPEDSAASAPETGADSGDTAQTQAESGQDAQRLALLEAALADSKDQMLRALAESENTRKRLLREREDVRKYAISEFARDLLDFSDNFRRALASIPADIGNADARIGNVVAGLEAMEKELLKTLEKQGIRKLEPLGEPFNANFHEALFEAPGTGKAPGTIVQTIEPGYVLHDRLLRPARVGIAKNDGQNGEEQRKPGGQIDYEA